MPKIKAAVCHAFGQPLTVEDVELRAPVAGEVEVTLRAVAICHSDIHYIDGAWVQPTSGKSQDVVNPSTNLAIGKLGHASKADLDKALKAP